MNAFGQSLETHTRNIDQTIHSTENPPAELAAIDERLNQLLAEREAERQELRESQDAVRNQAMHLATVADELAAAQNEFQANFKMIREEITRTIHDALLAYLQKPIAEIIGDVASASKDPDAGRKLAHSTAPHIWDWVEAQLPALVQRMDVQSMVERKVMAFSVDRVEEILRSVINNELRMIIITGYVLGGVIGLGTFFLSRLIGL